MGINKPNISEGAESKEAENFKLKLDIIFNFNLRSWLCIVLANVVDKMRRFFCMQREIVNGGENVQVCTCIMHITRNAAPSAWLFKDAANYEAAGAGAPSGSPAKIFMNKNVIYKIKNVEIIKIDEKQKTSNCKRCLPFCRKFWTCITGSISASSRWGTGSIWELQTIALNYIYTR